MLRVLWRAIVILVKCCVMQYKVTRAVDSGALTLVVEEELREGRQAHQVVQHAARVGVERGVVVRLARQQRAAALAPRRLQVLQPPTLSARSLCVLTPYT